MCRMKCLCLMTMILVTTNGFVDLLTSRVYTWEINFLSTCQRNCHLNCVSISASWLVVSSYTNGLSRIFRRQLFHWSWFSFVWFKIVKVNIRIAFFYKAPQIMKWWLRQQGRNLDVFRSSYNVQRWLLAGSCFSSSVPASANQSYQMMETSTPSPYVVM